MITGRASSGRIIAVLPTTLLGDDDGVGALARVHFGKQRNNAPTSTAWAPCVF